MSELRPLGFRPKTVEADKVYHTGEFIEETREQKIMPHPRSRPARKPLRVLLTSAPTISQRIRKRIKELFGWSKTTGGFRQSRHPRVERTPAQG